MRTVCYILERPYQMYKTILLQETTPDDSSEGKRERERGQCQMSLSLETVNCSRQWRERASEPPFLALT